MRMTKPINKEKMLSITAIVSAALLAKLILLKCRLDAKNPIPMIAIEVRTQARYVRSFARCCWIYLDSSVLFSSILPPTFTYCRLAVTFPQPWLNSLYAERRPRLKFSTGMRLFLIFCSEAAVLESSLAGILIRPDPNDHREVLSQKTHLF